MNVKLPPKVGTGQFSVFNPKVVVFVGANGSGKSRLGSWLESNNEPTHRISAQKALTMPIQVSPTSKDVALENFLYGTNNPNKAWLKEKGRKNSRWGNNPEIHLLDDFIHLLTYLHTEEYEESIKYRQASIANNNLQPPKTKLDIIQEVWNRILPHRKLMVKAGVIEASIPDSTVIYNAANMSDGERVIFYHIGESLCAPENSVLIIDEPENHVHKAIQSKLWNELEVLRGDCTFIYLTHEIDFAVSRTNSIKIWIKSFNNNLWDYELVNDEEYLPEHIFLEILGSRKDIFFIEGDKSSIDFHLYKEVFDNKTIHPLGGCSRVLEATRSFNALHEMHRLNAKGIIDRDRRTDADVTILRGGNILIPEVAEVENFFLLEEVIKSIAAKMHKDPHLVFATVKQNVIDFFIQELNAQAILHSKFRLSKLSRNGFNQPFQSRAEMELAKNALVHQLDVNAIYNSIIAQFQAYIDNGNYIKILSVFNNKGLLNRSQAGILSGITPINYIPFIIEELKKKTPTGNAIKAAIVAAVL